MTTTNLSHLLSPLQLEKLSFKNRVAMAPMPRGRADDNRVPNALMTEYYAQRANAGLIISEGTAPPSKAMAGSMHPAFTARHKSRDGNRS